MLRLILLAHVDQVLNTMALEAIDNDDLKVAKLVRQKAVEMARKAERGDDVSVYAPAVRDGDFVIHEFMKDASVTEVEAPYLDLVTIRVWTTEVFLEVTPVSRIFVSPEGNWYVPESERDAFA